MELSVHLALSFSLELMAIRTQGNEECCMQRACSVCKSAHTGTASGTLEPEKRESPVSSGKTGQLDEKWSHFNGLRWDLWKEEEKSIPDKTLVYLLMPNVDRS